MTLEKIPVLKGRKKVYNCETCGLSQNKFKNEENLEAEILIVRDFPSEVDVRFKNYFATTEGKYLKQSLLKAEIDLSKCYFTYALLCNLPKPPKNLPIDSIKSCGSNLVSLIKQLHNLKLIITCGEYGFKLFLNKSQLSKYRGELFRKNDLSIFPVYDPKYILTNKPEEATFINDLIKAKKIVNNEISVGKDIDFLLCKTVDDLEYTKKKLDEAEYYTFDIETVGGDYGLDPFSSHNKIMTIGFTTNTLESFCIPIDHPESELKDRELIIEYLKNILSNNSKRIAHNCLHFGTTVLMADGSKRLISDLVNNKFAGKVLSFNLKTNKVEAKSITNWFKIKDKNVLWMRIITENSINGYNCIQSPRLTHDHKVFTKEEGFIQTQFVQKGYHILTTLPSLNEVQKQVIIGSTLGDGSLLLGKTAKAKNAHFKVGHSDKQKDYLLWKEHLLKNISKGIIIRDNNRGFSSRINSKLHSFYTKSLPELTNIRKKFYFDKTNKKEISKELLNELTSLGIAIWYMDDGSNYKTTTRLHTCCFSDNSIDNIIDYFKIKYGIPLKKKKRITGYDLCIYNKIDGSKFFDIISEYIIPSMEYKIPQYYKNSNIGTSLSKLDNIDFIEYSYTKVLSIESAPLNNKVKGNKYDKYCIEVEDNHNFFTTLGLVSNSKFDSKNLTTLLGLPVTNIYADTLLASSTLNQGNRNSNSLKRLAVELLGYAENYSPLEDGIENDKRPLIDLSKYNCEDTYNTVLIYEILMTKLKEENLYDLFFNVVMKGNEALTDIELSGSAIDLEYGNKLLLKYEEKKLEILNKLLLYPEIVEIVDFNIGSPDHICQLLYDKFKLKCHKFTATGKRSADIDALVALTDAHPFVADLLLYKKYDKCISTYVTPLTADHLKNDGKIHCGYHQDTTATGRLSSSAPNLQNIPSRGEQGKEIKKMFIPSKKGWYILQADYSQIELRISAIETLDPVMIQAYKEFGDLHITTAKEVLGKSIITKEDRNKAKPINFGLIYLQSAQGFVKYAKKSYGITFTLAEAETTIKKFFSTYKGLTPWHNKTIEFAKKYGYVTNMFGRKRIIANINSKNSYDRGSAERQAVNHPIQSVPAEMMVLSLYYVNKFLKSKGMLSKIINTVHDSMILECPPEELYKVAKIIKTIMENIPTPFEKIIPIVADLEYGYNWGELESFKF